MTWIHPLPYSYCTEAFSNVTQMVMNDRISGSGWASMSFPESVYYPSSTYKHGF